MVHVLQQLVRGGDGGQVCLERHAFRRVRSRSRLRRSIGEERAGGVDPGGGGEGGGKLRAHVEELAEQLRGKVSE